MLAKDVVLLTPVPNEVGFQIVKINYPALPSTGIYMYLLIIYDDTKVILFGKAGRFKHIKIIIVKLLWNVFENIFISR